MSTKIKSILEAQLAKNAELLSAFPWEKPDAYAYWLAQSYYYVCHSTRLLAAAASRFTLAENHLHLRCLEHSKEERSHEVLASSDLKHLNRPLSKLPELSLTKALYQTQYYLIEHVHPISLFGYILFLEGLAIKVGRKCQLEVEKAHGSGVSSFLRVHADEDASHLEKAFSQIDKLTDSEKIVVTQSLVLSGDLYTQMLYEISDHLDLGLRTSSGSDSKLSQLG